MDIKQAFNEAVKFELARRGWGAQARLARELGIDTPQFNNIISGRRPSEEELRRAISEKLGIAYDEMITMGRQILDGNDPEVPPNQNHQPPKLPVDKVPVISWVQAGTWQDIEDSYPPGEADEWITVALPVGENSFALKVQGDSMSPVFLPGDIIVIDTSKQPETGSYVIAKTTNGTGDHGEATFKQFIRDGNNIYLKPLNLVYPIMDMTEKKFHIVGVVVQKISFV